MLKLTVYIGYSDKDANFFEEFSKHLSISGATILHRGMVSPGESTDVSAGNLLSKADVFVPLISAEYLTSSQGKKELSFSHPRIIPVVCRECQFKGTAIDGLQMLPRSKKPISIIRDRDRIWTEVTEEILSIGSEALAEIPALQTTVVHASHPISVPNLEKPKFSLSLRWGAFALTLTLSLFVCLYLSWPILPTPVDLGGSHPLDLFEYYEDLAEPQRDMSYPSPEDMTNRVDMVRKRPRDMAGNTDMGSEHPQDLSAPVDLLRIDAMSQLVDMSSANKKAREDHTTNADAADDYWRKCYDSCMASLLEVSIYRGGGPKEFKNQCKEECDKKLKEKKIRNLRFSD